MGVRLDIDPGDPTNLGSRVIRALANDTRVEILRHLGDHHIPVVQIAEQLGLPLSTASLHIATLEQAGLVHTTVRPASRGLQKVCARTYEEILIRIPMRSPETQSVLEIDVPIGSYSDCRIEGPNCGLASSIGLIGYLGDPASFLEPDRHLAQLIWFRSGYLEYRLPNRMPPMAVATAIEISAELCSEAPGSDLEWPSDIGIDVNGVALGTWTSPSDFGARRGILTPLWWDIMDTQYGVLKQWRVDAHGTSIDGAEASLTTIDDLHLKGGKPITIRIGVDAKAENVGGLNLFGATFGNHPREIRVRVEFAAAGTAGGMSDIIDSERSVAKV